MLCSLIFYDTSRLARGILCDGKNSSTLCIIRLIRIGSVFYKSITGNRISGACINFIGDARGIEHVLTFCYNESRIWA